MQPSYRPLVRSPSQDLQRIDEPVTPAQLGEQALLVGAWLAINVGITLINKAVFSHYAFTFPLSLSLLHQAATWAAIALTLHAVYPAAYFIRNTPEHERRETVQPLPRQNMWRYVLFGALNAANVCASNAAMRYAAVSLREVVAATTPVLVCAGERLWLHTHHSLATYATLVPTVIGAIVVSLDGVDVTALGLGFSASVPVLVAMRSVASKMLMTTGDRLTPLNLLYRTSLPAALLILPLAVFADYEEASLGAWLISASGEALAVLALSTALAVALNFVSLSALRATSPLTLQIAGNFKSAITIIVSFLFIEDAAPPALGVVLTLAGCAAYAALRFHSTRPQEAVEEASVEEAAVEEAAVEEAAETAAAAPARESSTI